MECLDDIVEYLVRHLLAIDLRKVMSLVELEREKGKSNLDLVSLISKMLDYLGSILEIHIEALFDDVFLVIYALHSAFGGSPKDPCLHSLEITVNEE